MVGEPQGVGDSRLVGRRDGGVGLRGARAAGEVLGELPVHGPLVGLHHRLHLAHERGQVGHPGAARPAEESTERSRRDATRTASRAGARAAEPSTEHPEELLEGGAPEGVRVLAGLVRHDSKVPVLPSG